MQVFRDLTIDCRADQFGVLMADVERSLASGWLRDRAEEERIRTLALPAGVACFSCGEQGPRPAATLYLTEKEPGTFHASNVVPSKKHQLSHDEYNRILEEFYNDLVRPCADALGVRTELTEPRADLENWLSPEAAQRLRRFSAGANKSVGAAHPDDQRRWIDFVVAASREGGKLPAPILRRWLIEVEGWAPEQADQLTGEYEFGKELLAFVDGRRSA